MHYIVEYWFNLRFDLEIYVPANGFHQFDN